MKNDDGLREGEAWFGDTGLPGVNKVARSDVKAGPFKEDLESLPRQRALKLVRLSVSEIVCLRWAAYGRTADDVTHIECMDRRDVERHLMLAQEALKVSTLEDAVACAIVLHLL